MRIPSAATTKDKVRRAGADSATTVEVELDCRNEKAVKSNALMVK